MIRSVTAFFFCATFAQGEFLWIEGESATTRSIQKNGWYSGVKKDLVSNGDLLAHWGNQTGSAIFPINVSKSGDYTLWLRANPVGSKLEFRLGDQWQQADFKNQSHENINIAIDRGVDLRFLAWVRVDVKDLTVGDHQIEIRFTSGNHHHGMLDCLCLTSDAAWKPSKTLKPGEAPPYFPAPDITEANLDQWATFVRPSAEELGWRAIRWHNNLSEAAEEAERLQRPILLWAMNGHPCGET